MSLSIDAGPTYKSVGKSAHPGFPPSATCVVPSTEQAGETRTKHQTFQSIHYDPPGVILEPNLVSFPRWNPCPSNHCQKLPILVCLLAAWGCDGKERHLPWHAASARPAVTTSPVNKGFSCVISPVPSTTPVKHPWSTSNKITQKSYKRNLASKNSSIRTQASWVIAASICSHLTPPPQLLPCSSNSCFMFSKSCSYFASFCPFLPFCHIFSSGASQRNRDHLTRPKGLMEDLMDLHASKAWKNESWSGRKLCQSVQYLPAVPPSRGDQRPQPQFWATCHDDLLTWPIYWTSQACNPPCVSISKCAEVLLFWQASYCVIRTTIMRQLLMHRCVLFHFLFIFII